MGNKHGTGFNKNSTAIQVARDIRLDGKNVIVTGANTGLGKETARVLAKMGAHVIIACRDVQKGEQAKKEIEDNDQNAKVTVIKLDLTDLDSIESFVREFEALDIPLHILINNAGVMAISNYTETKNGFEMQFGTNHLGHFHLTTLLLPKLKEGQPSRVVVLSSTAHKMGGIRFEDISGKGTWYRGFMGGWNAYAQSKSANALFAVELNRRMHQEGLRITCNAVHPGVIQTELSRQMSKFSRMMFSLGAPFYKTIPQGAATTVYVATAPELDGIGGKYFEDVNETFPKEWVTNPSYAKQLWTISEDMIKNAPRPAPGSENDNAENNDDIKNEKEAPVANSEPSVEVPEFISEPAESEVPETLEVIETLEEEAEISSIEVPEPEPDVSAVYSDMTPERPGANVEGLLE